MSILLFYCTEGAASTCRRHDVAFNISPENSRAFAALPWIKVKGEKYHLIYCQWFALNNKFKPILDTKGNFYHKLLIDVGNISIHLIYYCKLLAD